MSSYQVFIDGFPGDNTLYFARSISSEPSGNTVTFAGTNSLTPDQLPHIYRMILWDNNVYVWYNSIRVLTITRGTPTDDGLDVIRFTYEIVSPLAL